MQSLNSKPKSMQKQTSSHDNIIIKKKTRVEISINPSSESFDLNQKVISQVLPRYNNKSKSRSDGGVLKTLSISETINLLNSISKDLKKGEAPALLKGIYKGGTTGEHCIEASPFLFIDIDVKKGKENKALVDPKNNSDVWDYMKSISVFMFRSFSGLGMAGLLYVPRLKGLFIENKELHKTIGDAITSKLSEEIFKEKRLKVNFDSSQSRFRQLRYTAYQKTPIDYNPNHKQFDTVIHQEDVISSSGVPSFQFKGKSTNTGSIQYQYNQNNNIEDTLIACGFVHLHGNRYLHPKTTSDSTGIVNSNNTFFSFSSSFTCGLFRPYSLYAHCHNLTYEEFNKQLKENGYQNIPVDETLIENAITKLNHHSLGSKDIFEICIPLKSLTIEQKYQIVDQLNVDEIILNHIHHYLELNDLKIRYNKELSTDKFLSDILPDILNYIKKVQKVCIYSDTGSGKTTAFIKHYKKKNEKVIFLVPLQAIAYQIEKNFNIPCLTANSDARSHSNAKTSNIVVATYEQGIKHIGGANYDCVIIDEIHNLITANSYKKEIISELSKFIKNNNKSKILGLTGTPSNIFKNLGFDLIKVIQKKATPQEIVERFTNLSGYQTILSHISHNEGKMIFRYNNVNELKLIKKELCSSKAYSDNEILVLYASERIKKSEAFQALLKNQKFDEQVRIILTTSIIDEGVSIYQDGFKSVVYVESKNDLRPEAMKQYFSIFRNKDMERINYLYKSFNNSLDTMYFNEDDFFLKAKETLTQRANQFKSYSTYMDIFNNDDFYYSCNSEVNLSYLAYYTTNKTFEYLNPYQFDAYLQYNYNMEVNRDTRYNATPIDQRSKFLSERERNSALCDVWENEFPTIVSMLKTESNDPAIKQEVSNSPYDFNELVAEFIAQNLKFYERMFKYYLRLKVLKVEPKEYLMGDKTFRKPQWINNKLFFLETMATINSACEKDQKRKSEILSFVSALVNKSQFNKQDIIEEFNKYSNTQQCSTKAIILLLKKFAKITYDKRRKTYNVRRIIGLW